MILSSQSPRRIDILRQVGIEPDVRPQDVDETPLAGEHPKAMVARLAQMKADAAAESTTRSPARSRTCPAGSAFVFSCGSPPP